MLLRRRWVEEERFAFPLVKVPVAVVKAPESERLINASLRNKLLWIGVGAVTVYRTLGGLNRFFPSVPTLYKAHTIGFPDRPWSFAGAIPVHLYPLMIGLAYLLTADVSFSMWFFCYTTMRHCRFAGPFDDRHRSGLRRI